MLGPLLRLRPLGPLRRKGKETLWLTGRAAAAPPVALRAPSGAAALLETSGDHQPQPRECYLCPRSKVLPMSPNAQGEGRRRDILCLMSDALNQPPPFEDVNLFTADPALVEALRREGAGWAEERVRAFGEIAGRRQTIVWGFQANEHPPALRTHDRRGERIDEVEFHPAWHSLLALGVEHGLHALPWREERAGAHVARAALFLLLAEVEAGVGCPLSMTYSVVPALRVQPELAAEWEPRFTSIVYDSRFVPAG